MLDNIADLLLTVSLLAAVFEFPTKFALGHMVPGTALGVLVGDLLYFWMAVALARRLNRNDITAMPLGLDTPSTFGMVFFVLGPAFIEAKRELGILGVADPAPELLYQAATKTWHVGICGIVLSGVFKLVCAVGAGYVRQALPRAGLLGSLAAIALVLISFLPLIEILHVPVAGLAAFSIILGTLVARAPLPFKLPGAFGALLVGGGMYLVMDWFGWLGGEEPLWITATLKQTFGAETAGSSLAPHEALFPLDWLRVFTFGWLQDLPTALKYLPIIIPFALATVVGGIDCTESAAAAGDEFDTRRVIGVEALATLVAGLCGGVIQTTPYIGHPAYKAMGGRAAYTLATALFVGGAGVFGYFGYLYGVIPKAAVFPILVFIGLEITAQSFHATPRKHFAAVALGCVPAMAALVVIYVDDLQGQYAAKTLAVNKSIQDLNAYAARADDPGLRLQALELRRHGEALERSAGNPVTGRVGTPDGLLGKNLHTARLLSAGFLITSLLWASALAALIDRRMFIAALFLLTAAGCALFGIIHSPLPGAPLVTPWRLPDNLPAVAQGQTPIDWALGYGCAAALVALWGAWLAWRPPAEEQNQVGDQAHAPQAAQPPT